jgi:hypothetical protein
LLSYPVYEVNQDLELFLREVGPALLILCRAGSSSLAV